MNGIQSAGFGRIVPANRLIKGLSADVRALQFVRRETQSPVLRVAAVGDIAAVGRVARWFVPRSDRDPMTSVASVFHWADVTLGNYEGVLLARAGGAPFTAPVRVAERLARTGITVVHLANNHILDEGVSGALETARAFRDANIGVLGLSLRDVAVEQPLLRQAGDLSVGFLGAGKTGQRPRGRGAVVRELNWSELLEETRSAAAQVDLLVVSIHTGYMFMDYPHPEDCERCRELVRAGATLVLVHHAHVLQGVDIRPGGAAICYSLGNFLLDWAVGEVPAQFNTDLQRTGGVFCFELDRGGIASAFLVPTWISDDLRVEWAVEQRGDAALERVRRLSIALQNSGWREEFWRQRAERNVGHQLRVFVRLLQSGKILTLARELSRLRPHHFRMGLRWLWGIVRGLKHA